MLHRLWKTTLSLPSKEQRLSSDKLAVLEAIERNYAACSEWLQGDFNHQDYARYVTANERIYQGVSYSLWETDEEMVWQLISSYSRSLSAICAIYKTIESLRSVGYVANAPSGEKRRYLLRISEEALHDIERSRGHALMTMPKPDSK